MHPPKPIRNNDHISMLMPTRGRPVQLDNALRSYDDTLFAKELFDVWVYADGDDDATLSYYRSKQWSRYGYKIHWLFGDRTPTMGHMTNKLWQISETDAGIYMPSADDYLIREPHWDQHIREAFDSFPDRIGLAYLPDPDNDGGEVTWTVLSAQWLNITGRFLTEHFPYWYDDLWLAEVARLIGRLVRLPIRVEAQGGKGKTPRMKNLVFWNKFYVNTLDERIEDANKLLKAMDGGTAPHIDESAPLVASFQAGRHYTITDKELTDIEALLSDRRNYDRLNSWFDYLQTELSAVRHIFSKMEKHALDGTTHRMAPLIENLKHTSFAIFDIERYIYKVVYQTRNGRDSGRGPA